MDVGTALNVEDAVIRKIDMVLPSLSLQPNEGDKYNEIIIKICKHNLSIQNVLRNIIMCKET